MLNRRTMLVGMLAANAVAVTPAWGQAVSATAVARKVNVAGRQRMLSQRMSMASAMARLGIDLEANIATLETAASSFEAAQVGLRSGSDSFGLLPETHPSVISALNKVDIIWGEMRDTTQAILQRGKVARADFNVIADVNLRLLSRANIVVKKLVSAYAEDDRDGLGVAQAIDMAGRQRMLSQKMIKEAAMIGLKFKRSENREFLTETTELFDSSLFTLMYGNENEDIPAPPDAVLAKLKEVETLWLDLYPLMDEIASLGRAGAFELEELSYSANELLSLSNEAVMLYEQSWSA